MSTRYIPERNPLDGYLFSPPQTLEDVWDIAMIRPCEEWIPLPIPTFNGNYCVNIGPGAKHMFGWRELDYPDWDAETDSLPFQDNTVLAIFTAHTLDHLSPQAVTNLLVEGQRVLVDGGTITVVVPHFLGQLAWECIEHKSRFGLKTWRNILDNPMYDPIGSRDQRGRAFRWEMRVGFNRILGNEEANLALVSQLVRVPRREKGERNE